MYLIHMPFAFVKDPNEYAPIIEPDGRYNLDLNTDPVSVWKVNNNIINAFDKASIIQNNDC